MSFAPSTKNEDVYIEPLSLHDGLVLDTSISLSTTTHMDALELVEELVTKKFPNDELLEMWIPPSKSLVDTIVSLLDSTIVDPISSIPPKYGFEFKRLCIIFLFFFLKVYMWTFLFFVF